MTGGLGFTTLMQSITRTNRSFLRHTDEVRSKKDNLTYLTDKSKMEYRKVSDEELEILKEKYRAEKIKDDKRDLVILLLTVLAVINLVLTIIIIAR